MSTGPHANLFGLHQYDSATSFFGEGAILPEVLITARLPWPEPLLTISVHLAMFLPWYYGIGCWGLHSSDHLEAWPTAIRFFTTS